MARIGIFAGTFDPVHKGHIGFALQALEEGLERVIFVPEYLPRKQQVTDFSHRVAMLKLATSEHPGLEVAKLTHEQFSVKRTLPELKRRFGTELSLLVGSDVAKTLADWPDASELLREMPLVVGLRGSDMEQDVESCLARVGQTVQLSCIPSPEMHMTSKLIRQDGASSDDLHPSVQLYMLEHALYEPSLA